MNTTTEAVEAALRAEFAEYAAQGGILHDDFPRFTRAILERLHDNEGDAERDRLRAIAEHLIWAAKKDLETHGRSLSQGDVYAHLVEMEEEALGSAQ